MTERLWAQLRGQWMGALALFLLLFGGTAYAAKQTLARNSVGSKQIAPAAVKTSELASNAVTGAKVDDGSLRPRDFAAGSLPAGEPGSPGAQGRPGPKGDAGPRGPSNVYARFLDAYPDLPNTFDNYGTFNFGKEAIVSLPLPAGSFQIQAKGFANGDAGNVGCVLVAGPNVDGSLATLPSDSSVEPLVMQVLHRFDGPGVAELRCTDYGAPGDSRGLYWIKVHDTQVESISNVPQE
jgi:hypothetical protein